MKTADLFIFDMDGLMFDTGRLAYKAYLKSAQQYDFEMVHDVYYYLTGRTEPQIIEAMKELYGPSCDVALWRQAINHFKADIFNETKRVYKKKGLEELLGFAKNNEVLVAVASSSPKEKIVAYLELEKVDHFIDFIVGGDEVINSKPDKEIFAKACAKANIPPQRAIVFEDSMVGIKAARAAGIKACLVKDDITDLPVYIGRHRIQIDLKQQLKPTIKPAYTFHSLLDAKNFFENSSPH